MESIAQAVEAVEYPVTERSYADLKLTFESRGVSWKSWSGDVTTVLVSPMTHGSKATFTSKGKPSGTARVAMKSNAMTWVGRVVPGFGSLWRDPRSVSGISFDVKPGQSELRSSLTSIKLHGSGEVLTPKGRRRARKLSLQQDQERLRQDTAPEIPPPAE
jgi:hypothetical protein